MEKADDEHIFERLTNKGLISAEVQRGGRVYSPR